MDEYGNLDQNDYYTQGQAQGQADAEAKARAIQDALTARYTAAGQIDPESVYTSGKGPRVYAEKMINGMSNDFYNAADQYSGISLKKDLEAMTTYNGNKGMLGELNAQGQTQNTANFANAEGQQGRMLSRFGGQQTAEQKAIQGSEMARGKVLGSVDSSNRNQTYQNDLNKQLMSGLNVAPKA